MAPKVLLGDHPDKVALPCAALGRAALRRSSGRKVHWTFR
jgi:hypothetical protein